MTDAELKIDPARLTSEAVIFYARQRGYAGYFPTVPNFDAQQAKTANAAREWLKNAPVNCEQCRDGSSAHNHATIQ